MAENLDSGKIVESEAEKREQAVNRLARVLDYISTMDENIILDVTSSGVWETLSPKALRERLDEVKVMLYTNPHNLGIENISSRIPTVIEKGGIKEEF